MLRELLKKHKFVIVTDDYYICPRNGRPQVLDDGNVLIRGPVKLLKKNGGEVGDLAQIRLSGSFMILVSDG